MPDEMNIDLAVTEEHGLSLKLMDMKSGAPGLTSEVGAYYAQAAGVCLEHQGHESPTSMLVSGEVMADAMLEWAPVTDQTRRNWKDDEEATEYGACAIACLLVPGLSGLHVVERSRKGTGFDYWLGPTNNDESLFQSRARLEVSGIRAGTKATIAARVRQKLKQTERSDSSLLPAGIVIVEFSQPESRVAKRRTR